MVVRLYRGGIYTRKKERKKGGLLTFNSSFFFNPEVDDEKITERKEK